MQINQQKYKPTGYSKKASLSYILYYGNQCNTDICNAFDACICSGILKLSSKLDSINL